MDSDTRIKIKDGKVIIIPEEIKYLVSLISLNVIVTLIWKIKHAEKFMWRYFTNSFASSNLFYLAIKIQTINCYLR